MHYGFPWLLVASVACAPCARVQASSSSLVCQASDSKSATDLTIERILLEDAETARLAGEFVSARGMIAEATAMLLARPVGEQDAAWLALLVAAGRSARRADDVRTENAAWRRVYDVRSRTLPDEHRELRTARYTLGHTLLELGDWVGARALFEKVLEIEVRTRDDDDLDLQATRASLAMTIEALGDYAGARLLKENVLEVLSRTLPEDDEDLLYAQQGLAATISMLGDFAGARALEEKVLEVRSRTLSHDDPELLAARHNLAVNLAALGELAAARALQEQVLEVRLRTLSTDGSGVQTARLNLAGTLKKLGDFVGARALEEQVLEVFARVRPLDYTELQAARGHLARTLTYQSARLRRAAAGTADDAEDVASARLRCGELIEAACREELRVAREAVVGSFGREAEERCSNSANQVSTVLSYASGLGVFEPLRKLESDAFVLAETIRGAADTSAELTRRAATSPKYAALHAALKTASDELAELVRQGTTSTAFDRARIKRESAERQLVGLAHEQSGGQRVGEFDATSIVARLDAHSAAVGYVRFEKRRVQFADELDSMGQSAIRFDSVSSLGAFVVRGASLSAPRDDASVPTFVDLGPIAPIETAARRWREAVGAVVERGAAVDDSDRDRVRPEGAALRELVLDPLLAAIGDADRVIVALDDVLHLVPLDALPLADGDGLVGDQWRVETRATLTELLLEPREPTGTALVVLGGASFNLPSVALDSPEVPAVDEGRPSELSSRLRGTVWERGFVPLTHSAEEARGVGALYAEVHGGGQPAVVLEKRKASREALEQLAPRARYVHIATHGWFAPESIKAWSDREAPDERTGRGSSASGQEHVRGISPMLLCGLALAGANLPDDATQRLPGLVTADELSTFDLSNCELAVLSACDTNVGDRRAGQGVASLQKALQIAGARSVITSLWKVPDEATKDLMLDFYRRMWVEKKPKAQALWEAKRKLRDAKDERGELKYATRDWAAWVLTGNPQ